MNGVSGLYDVALARPHRRASLVLRHVDGAAVPLPVSDWCADRLPGDRELLGRCTGPTLDVGCGPGRLVGALTALSVPALGIDLSVEAVRLGRRRGAVVLRRDVFGRVPGEGRWAHALLADGNIGIGGDPVALLRRCAEVVRPGGRVLVELQPPDGRTRTGAVRLECGPARGDWFRWSTVRFGDHVPLARACGLRIHDAWPAAGRWFAELATPEVGR